MPHTSQDDWCNGDVLKFDPEQEIDFDKGLPSTISTRRSSTNLTTNSVPLGKGKYAGTDLDFDRGLPSTKCTVQISKAAAHEQFEKEIPTRVHHIKKDTSVSADRSKPVDRKLAVAMIHEPSIDSSKVPSEVMKKIVTHTTNGKKEFCVESESSGRSFGCYSTKDEAESRLRQVERFAKSEEDPIPLVLTWEAVRKGAMPESGESGLPKSLEQDVPPRFRFWKCSDPFEARAVRDSLVEEQIFTPATIRKVNGEWRRAVVETVQKLFLSPVYDPSEPVEIPPMVRAVEKVSSFLKASEGHDGPVLFDEQITGVLGIDTILEKASQLSSDWVIAARDTEEIRKAIVGPAFKLKSRDDLVFVTSATIEKTDLIEWVQFERSEEVLKFAFSEGRTIPLLKAKEERIVYGIVLEPDEVDSQKDTVSKEEIEQACHKFMEDFGGLGRQHEELVNGKLVLLENFIAPVDFEVEGQPVKAGSWLMKERVVDDKLWGAVKKGQYTGYSIGGSAIRKPVK